MRPPVEVAIAQAGAIAVRTLPTLEILLVRSKADTPEWIFPKGHVEAGETSEETALRELREEAGVLGRVLAFVGRSHFRRAQRDYSVDYFLVRADGVSSDREAREQRWSPPAEALELLTYADARSLLHVALELFRSPSLRERALD